MTCWCGGEGTPDNDANLRKVPQRAREVGLKLTPKKCRSRCDQIPDVGHLFSKTVLKPDGAKVTVVKDMHAPDSPEALRRFLGMVNYQHKFISNLSGKTAPLRELLRRDTQWSWEAPEQKAFEVLKLDISQPPVLKFFDPAGPVTLSFDGSKSGLGATCLQDGYSVGYAS